MIFTSSVCVLAMQFKRLRNSDLPANRVILSRSLLTRGNAGFDKDVLREFSLNLKREKGMKYLLQ